MTRTCARCKKHLAAFATMMLLAFAPTTFAADGFDSTYVEVGYGIDSTIEAFGQSYDSDDGYRIDGSYQINPHLSATAQYYSAG